MKSVVTWLLIIWAAERLAKSESSSQASGMTPGCDTPGLPYGVNPPSWMIPGSSRLPVINND